jgi:hypothetical protein
LWEAGSTPTLVDDTILLQISVFLSAPKKRGALSIKLGQAHTPNNHLNNVFPAGVGRSRRGGAGESKLMAK